MRTVQEIHAEWEKAVLGGKEFPDLQRTEMKKAFYSGMAAMFNELQILGDLSDDAGVNELVQLEHELRSFFHSEILKR